MEVHSQGRRPTGWRTCLLLVAGLILLLGLLIWSLFAVTCYVLERKVQQKRGELQAQGIPVTIAEIIPEPVPDDENAAVVYQQVFQVDFDAEVGAQGPELFAGLSDEDFKALAGFVDNPHDSQAHQRATEILAQPEVQKALEIFEKGSQRPACVFPVKWDKAWAATFPHLSQFRRAAQLLAARVVLSTQEGDMEEALHYLCVGLRMASHVSTEPSTFSQTMRTHVYDIVFDAARTGITSLQVPGSASAELCQVLAEADVEGGHLLGIEGDFANSLNYFDLVRHDPDEALRLFGFDHPDFALTVYYSPLLRPRQLGDQLFFLDIMEQRMAITEKPYRLAKPELKALTQEVKEHRGFVITYGLVLFDAAPLSGRMMAQRDESQAKIDLCRVVLALKAYKYEQGQYPDNLAELQPTLDWQLPEDVFSGRPFIYRRQGEGFLLYSLGRDLDDDGGRAEPLDPEEDSEGRDIVWACPR